MCLSINDSFSIKMSMRINIYTDIPVGRWHIMSTGYARHFELMCDTTGEYRDLNNISGEVGKIIIKIISFVEMLSS